MYYAFDPFWLDTAGGCSLANKQDLGGASEVELDSLMNLQEVVNTARCLTRLDESAATDLKNDKGIFDGFRWEN